MLAIAGAGARRSQCAHAGHPASSGISPAGWLLGPHACGLCWPAWRGRTRTRARTRTRKVQADAHALRPALPQDGLLSKLGGNLDNIPRKIRDAPFVQIPLGVTEDRLVGTVDIEASMKVGLLGWGCWAGLGCAH
jgi:hypothetical protein